MLVYPVHLCCDYPHRRNGDVWSVPLYIKCTCVRLMCQSKYVIFPVSSFRCDPQQGENKCVCSIWEGVVYLGINWFVTVIFTDLHRMDHTQFGILLRTQPEYGLRVVRIAQMSSSVVSVLTAHVRICVAQSRVCRSVPQAFTRSEIRWSTTEVRCGFFWQTDGLWCAPVLLTAVLDGSPIWSIFLWPNRKWSFYSENILELLKRAWL